MKIKQFLSQILLELLVLFTIKELVGGFTFSKSTSYVIMFLVLFAISGWIATRIQIFFLLPRALPFIIVLHTIVIGLIFYCSNAIIGGITITALLPSFLHLFSKSMAQQMSGVFGTIGVVSLLIGIVYQVIIWLNSEK